MAISSSSTGNDPWAWLGLLKWSLQYSDGTKDTPASPMSDEDRAFLEKVMKEGIIDENERMRYILDQATRAMEHYKKNSKSVSDEEKSSEQELSNRVGSHLGRSCSHDNNPRSDIQRK